MTAGGAMADVGAVAPVPSARTPKHPAPIGAPCPNCRTSLAGPWCQACGQSSDDFHRSLARLAREVLQDTLDIDSRLWRTLPDLALRPGRLTRGYLDGHRMAQIPPFRLFMIVAMVVFMAAGLGGPRPPPVVDLGAQAGAKHSAVQVHLGDGPYGPGRQWLSQRLTAAAKNPVQFESTLTTWAQRLAVLLLPMSALLLGLMFFWRRGVMMFDHLIFSMHSLSFQGMLVAVVVAGSQLSGAFAWLLLAAPVHLFVHLKGAYGLGAFSTLARMLVLFVGSLIGLSLALVGLVLIGLVETGR
jgi:hypothetical protein